MILIIIVSTKQQISKEYTIKETSKRRLLKWLAKVSGTWGRFLVHELFVAISSDIERAIACYTYFITNTFIDLPYSINTVLF